MDNGGSVLFWFFMAPIGAAIWVIIVGLAVAFVRGMFFNAP